MDVRVVVVSSIKNTFDAFVGVLDGNLHCPKNAWPTYARRILLVILSSIFFLETWLYFFCFYHSYWRNCDERYLVGCLPCWFFVKRQGCDWNILHALGYTAQPKRVNVESDSTNEALLSSNGLVVREERTGCFCSSESMKIQKVFCLGWIAGSSGRLAVHLLFLVALFAQGAKEVIDLLPSDGLVILVAAHLQCRRQDVFVGIACVTASAWFGYLCWHYGQGIKSLWGLSWSHPLGSNLTDMMLPWDLET